MLQLTEQHLVPKSQSILKGNTKQYKKKMGKCLYIYRMLNTIFILTPSGLKNDTAIDTAKKNS